MDFLLLSGGSIDNEFVKKWVETHTYDKVVAIDCGLKCCIANDIVPDYLIGDFDSIDAELVELYIQSKTTIVMRYPEEKNFTDLEIAIGRSIEEGAVHIHVLGATGTRMDHVMGAIQSLMIPLGRKVYCCLVDKHNLIELVEEHLTINKAEMFGKYVSIIPLTPLTEVTLKGMKYGLDNFRLSIGSTRGISNEIVDDRAEIEVHTGVVIVIQSRD